MSVVQKGKRLFSKGYGVVDHELNLPVDANNTVFRIASVSKVFTAVAAIQFVKQGEIYFQDNVETYLDGYKITNSHNTPVTIEQLLTQTKV
ncbi:hypothetical protein QD47_09060 [Paenibacillus terrae]|uniref:Beta-lactamase-related domain-containing protein n=2 Tax=Paenibacillus terrae TaxID=159743 RepID=A0A0D7X4Q0_9BACL|nr:hypothetical protein QD47_09060 [Paenibacillus terrae]